MGLVTAHFIPDTTTKIIYDGNIHTFVSIYHAGWSYELFLDRGYTAKPLAMSLIHDGDVCTGKSQL